MKYTDRVQLRLVKESVFSSMVSRRGEVAGRLRETKVEVKSFVHILNEAGATMGSEDSRLLAKHYMLPDEECIDSERFVQGDLTCMSI